MKTNVPESVPSVPKVSGAASLMATCTRRYGPADRKSTRLNSSHLENSYAVFCLKKKKSAIQGSDVPNPDEAVPSTVSGAVANAGNRHLEGTLQPGTCASSAALVDVVGLGHKSAV